MACKTTKESPRWGRQRVPCSIKPKGGKGQNVPGQLLVSPRSEPGFLTCKRGLGCLISAGISDSGVKAVSPPRSGTSPEWSRRQRLMTEAPAWHPALLTVWAHRVIMTTFSGDSLHCSLRWLLPPFSSVLAWTSLCPLFLSVLTPSWIIFPSELPTRKPLGEPQAKTLGTRSNPQDAILELSPAEDSCLRVSQRCRCTLSQCHLTPRCVPCCLARPVSRVHPVSPPVPTPSARHHCRDFQGPFPPSATVAPRMGARAGNASLQVGEFCVQQPLPVHLYISPLKPH